MNEPEFFTVKSVFNTSKHLKVFVQPKRWFKDQKLKTRLKKDEKRWFEPSLKTTALRVPSEKVK